MRPRVIQQYRCFLKIFPENNFDNAKRMPKHNIINQAEKRGLNLGQEDQFSLSHLFIRSLECNTFGYLSNVGISNQLRTKMTKIKKND